MTFPGPKNTALIALGALAVILLNCIMWGAGIYIAVRIVKWAWT